MRVLPGVSQALKPSVSFEAMSGKQFEVFMLARFLGEEVLKREFAEVLRNLIFNAAV